MPGSFGGRGGESQLFSGDWMAAKDKCNLTILHHEKEEKNEKRKYRKTKYGQHKTLTCTCRRVTTRDKGYTAHVEIKVPADPERA